MWQIPKSYDALYSHIVKRHEHVLPSFLSGWQALPTYFKSSWLNPQPISAHYRYSTMYMMTWTSWPAAAYTQIKNISPSIEYDEFRRELTRWTAHHIDHEGIAFGLPKVPKEAKASKASYDFGAEYMSRGDVAGKFVKIVLHRAMIEAQDWLMAKVEAEGFLSLYPLLEGESLFRLIAEFMTVKEESQTKCLSSADEDGK